MLDNLDGLLSAKKVKLSSLQASRTKGDLDARVHIFAATALGRGWVASPTLGRLYPGKAPVFIIQKAEWTQGSVWTPRSEEISPSLRHTGPNPDLPACSKTPYRLSYLAHRWIICKNIMHLDLLNYNLPR